MRIIRAFKFDQPPTFENCNDEIMKENSHFDWMLQVREQYVKDFETNFGQHLGSYLQDVDTRF